MSTVVKSVKKRIALVLGYTGGGYYGSQILQGQSPPLATIEGELFPALGRCGLVRDSNQENVGKIGWIRGSRTDKGVSAAVNVVSFKAQLPAEVVNDTSEALQPLVDKLNQELPSAIHVFGMQRVMGGFNPRKMCHGRYYEYLVPSHLFQRSPLRPSLSELLTRPDEQRDALDDDDTPTAAQTKTPHEEDNISEEERAFHKSFRIDADKLQRISSMLATFHGSHKFHNFSRRLSPSAAQARRVIRDFRVDHQPLYADDGEEWLRLHVEADSFVLNQIRKMVGLVVAVGRGLVGADYVEECFGDDRFHVPLAPSDGLFLWGWDMSPYDEKLQRMRESGADVPACYEGVGVWSCQTKPTVQEFATQHIQPAVMSDTSSLALATWVLREEHCRLGSVAVQRHPKRPREETPNQPEPEPEQSRARSDDHEKCGV